MSVVRPELRLFPLRQRLYRPRHHQPLATTWARMWLRDRYCELETWQGRDKRKRGGDGGFEFGRTREGRTTRVQAPCHTTGSPKLPESDILFSSLLPSISPSALSCPRTISSHPSPAGNAPAHPQAFYFEATSPRSLPFRHPRLPM